MSEIERNVISLLRKQEADARRVLAEYQDAIIRMKSIIHGIESELRRLGEVIEDD